MLQKFLCLCAVFSMYATAYTQNSFTLKGNVYNAKSLEPIMGVTIFGEQNMTISSSEGSFVLGPFYKKNTSIRISHIGYKTQDITINFSSSIENLKIYLKETTNSLKKVELHGKSKNRLYEESPLVTYNVDEDFLQKNRENSLMQTLQNIPGVSTINIGSGQSKPVIRGLGFNRVVVVQNGIKHEAQQWGSDHGLEIDQYGIENVSVIKGPASLLYGSDAIAGVVDIQPPKIPHIHSFTGNVNLLAETNNDLLGISTGVQSRKEHWFYRARLTYRDYGDYKVPADVINYNNYVFQLSKNHLRNTAGREANASFSLGYIARHIKSETFFSNVNAKNGFFANAHGLEVRTSDIDYDRSNRDIDLPFHTVNHFKVLNNTSIQQGMHKISIELGYQHNHREEHSEPVAHGYMPKPDNSKERIFKKSTYALNLRDEFKPNDRNKLIYGINTEYQDNNIAGWGFLIPAYNRFTTGAFAYDHYELTHDFHLMLGLRYDYGTIETKEYVDWYETPVHHGDGTTTNAYVQRAKNKTNKYGNYSASIGASYIANNTKYKLNIGRSFRMPLANELASDGKNYHMYRYEKGNLDLDPESSYQIDVDFDHTNNLFRVCMSPFVNFFDNFIYLNPTANYNNTENLQTYEYTQAKVFRAGGELQASTTLFDKLTLDGTLEYVYSRQTSGPKKGFTLPFAPPLSGLISANYEFKNTRFFIKPQLTATAKIVAAQKEIVPPEEITNGYQVFHLSIQSDVQLFKNLAPVTIRLKLNNVLDTKYFNHTSFYRLIDVPEAGRNISLSMTIPLNH
ncbi:TonB-dependent receptor [Ochrovirga pacifica]|uniref:TonB-dependent receptor n=1 Tax=Ochrovirga pacifica TaxID=1042376 RepID=UPI0002557771|nr:TonB-dependent receptor [Ochrovirga pacifica]